PPRSRLDPRSLPSRESPCRPLPLLTRRPAPRLRGSARGDGVPLLVREDRPLLSCVDMGRAPARVPAGSPARGWTRALDRSPPALPRDVRRGGGAPHALLQPVGILEDELRCGAVAARRGTLLCPRGARLPGCSQARQQAGVTHTVVLPRSSLRRLAA